MDDCCDPGFTSFVEVCSIAIFVLSLFGVSRVEKLVRIQFASLDVDTEVSWNPSVDCYSH